MNHAKWLAKGFSSTAVIVLLAIILSFALSRFSNIMGRV